MNSATALAALAASADSPTARTSRVPTITPSATAPTSRRLLGRADSEAHRDRDRRVGLGGA